MEIQGLRLLLPHPPVGATLIAGSSSHRPIDFLPVTPIGCGLSSSISGMAGMMHQMYLLLA